MLGLFKFFFILQYNTNVYTYTQHTGEKVLYLYSW